MKLYCVTYPDKSVRVKLSKKEINKKCGYGSMAKETIQKSSTILTICGFLYSFGTQISSFSS